MKLERPHAQAAFEVVELARYASPQIAVKDRRLNAAELGARVWERRALEHMSNFLLREAEAQHDRGGRHSEHDRLLKDRVVYDNAASANALEIRRELEIVDRLRNRSYNVQRTIEGLVEMREQLEKRPYVTASQKLPPPLQHGEHKRGLAHPRITFGSNDGARSTSLPCGSPECA